MNSWPPGGVRTNMKLVRGRSGDALVAGLEDEELREAFETGVSPREVAELPGPGPRPGDRPGSANCSWWLLHRSRGVDDPVVLVGLGQGVPRAGTGDQPKAVLCCGAEHLRGREVPLGVVGDLKRGRVWATANGGGE